jgi:hypothetical protein
MKSRLFFPYTAGLRYVLILTLVVFLLVTACSPRAWRQAAESGAEAATTTPSAGALTATPSPEIVTYATVEPTVEAAAPVTPTPTPVGASQPTPTSKPTATVEMPTRPANENPLTGLSVADASVLNRRPLHVRVGNDAGARPQVNLSRAEIVYEEIVEWWVTRFTAVFLGESPEMIAPIRSARLINTQLTQQYQAALANSGGSDGVRWELSQLPIVNLDEYFWPQPYFYRENEGWQTRLAVNGKAARQLMQSEDMDEEVALRGFTFSDEPVGGDEAETIYIPYPKQTSTTEWRYDPATGKYLRWVMGEPFLDFVDDVQISAANVIVYYAEHQPTDIVEDSNGATSIRIIVNGEGRAQIFRDGRVIEGRWRTDGSQTPEFLFENGQPIPLKRGNTWIEVVPLDYEVLVNATPEPTEES